MQIAIQRIGTIESSMLTDNQGNVIASSYDNLGRRTSVLHPDAGLTTLEYDLSGNLRSRQTPNTKNQGDKTIQYFYDFNRLKKITYPYNWQNNVEYHYGEAGAPFNPNYALEKIGYIYGHNL